MTLMRADDASKDDRLAIAKAAYGSKQISMADRCELLLLAAERLPAHRASDYFRLSAAMGLVLLRRPREAITILEALHARRQKDETVPDIGIWLARAYVHAGRHDQAFDELDRYDQLPEASQQESTLLRADNLLRAGNPALAMRVLTGQELWSTADQQRSEHRDTAIRVRIDAELASERFAPVIAYTDEWTDLGLQQPVLAFARAVALERLDRDDAVAALAAIVNGTGTTADDALYRRRSRIALARRAMRAGQLERARTWLRDLDGPGGLEQTVTEIHLSLREGAPVEQLAAPLERLQVRWREIVDSCQRLRPLPGGAASLQILERRNVLATIWSCWSADANGDADRRAVAERAAGMLLELDAAGSLAQRANAPAADPAAVRDHLLPDDGAVVFLLPASFQSFVLLLTESGWELVPAPGDRGLRRQVQAFGAELSRVHNDSERSPQRLRELGAALRDRVLPTSARRALDGVSRIAIVGRDLIGGLNFECLPWDGRWSWLGLAKAMHYLPSVALAVKHDREPWSMDGPTLRLVAPTVDAAVAAKWNVPAETLQADEVAAIVRHPEHTESVTGTDASPGAVFAPRTPAAITALFSHGIYDPERTCPAGLLLQPDGAHDGGTFFEDVAKGDRVIGDVALLCSCGSGRGTLQRGDDASWHLGGALMLRGTRMVGIADLDLGVASTTRFVLHVVQAAAEERCMDLAFLRARRAVADELGDRPGNWSLLRLEGPSARPLPQARVAPLHSSRWPLWLALAGIGVGIGVFVHRRRR